MADKMARVVFSRNLGRISYLSGLAIQRELIREHLSYLKSSTQRKPRNTLLLCEHDPVYTVGIRNKKFDVKVKERLEELGADFHYTNRGGLITFHGPGQLVCYPILNLADFSKSMKWYIAQLENTLIETCKTFDLTAVTTEETGVWVGDNKIAAIGVHANRWITSHGVALNCNTDLRWFDHIVPCGIVGKGVTSLSYETNLNITVRQVIEAFLNSFQSVFDCDLLHEEQEISCLS